MKFLQLAATIIGLIMLFAIRGYCQRGPSGTLRDSLTQVLKEVTVTGKKAALQNVNGKEIFLVNQSLVSKGGNAADLLRNVPTLQVDVDGNVSLRGSVNVKVLIDGKPTIIGKGDITQILRSIPASAIESIEVIPNPPANYEADGEGIINIVLKKNSRPGSNGSVTVGGGTLDSYNAGASLNYQTGKINLYGNYSLKVGNTLLTGFQNVTYLHPTDSVVYSNETFPAVTRNEIQFIKAGIDYSLTPRSTLGVSASFNSGHLHEDQLIPVNEYAANNALLGSFNRASFGMDAAAKYDFAGNRASLSCNATDIFNGRKRAFLSSSNAVLLDFQRHIESSRATLIFSYRFGKDPGASKHAKQEKRIEDAS